jgi:cell division inhibitor SepF
MHRESTMGAWHNAMVALGLANEVDEDYYEDETDRRDEVAPARRTERAPEVAHEREAQVTPIRQRQGNVVAVSHSSEDTMQRITTIHPRSYNDAKSIGESFRDGVPVIVNLSDMQDGDAKRMVDFCAGLVFGLRGSIERITGKVFLLSPEFVEVDGESTTDEGSFYNQS